MLNTEWEDDGEALKGLNWHGYAWAAECAWNASTTKPEDFNRRVGAVLFGEKGDHFGQAIRLLAKTHPLPGMDGMNNSRFWQDDFFSARSAPELEAESGRLLAWSGKRPSTSKLAAAKRPSMLSFSTRSSSAPAVWS